MPKRTHARTQDAGDEFDGTLWDVVYKGLATAKLQNMARPDAMVRRNAGDRAPRAHSEAPRACAHSKPLRLLPPPTTAPPCYASPLT